MTITLLLGPEEEARLEAIVHARGLSADALVREALDGILADASEVPESALSEPATGALLIAAMQASPYEEMDLEAARIA
jgi:ferritin-like metal-binding protein YciE